MTTKKNKSRNGTRKNKPFRLLQSFQKEITVIFLEILMMMKLFHWKTHNYAAHKASDDLYDKLNDHIDQFTEILLGKTGTRIDLIKTKNMKLIDVNSVDTLKKHINIFKKYLVDLNNNKAMKGMNNGDLYNIRDEILGDLNQFLYLLTLK